jgi:hypothetical protein
VTDAQCKAVETARTAKPAAAKKVDDLSAKMRDPNADRQTLMADLRAAYTELGVDMNVVRACRARRQRRGARRERTGGRAPGPPDRRQRCAPARRVTVATSQGTFAPPHAVTRTGLVFVKKGDDSWEPRVVRLGTADYDYTEVVSGLEEGERSRCSAPSRSRCSGSRTTTA